jgi:hypothetical protein
MESKIGRRALVDMMFLEEDQNESKDNLSGFVNTLRYINAETAKEILSGLKRYFDQNGSFQVDDQLISKNETEAKVGSVIGELTKAAEYYKEKSANLEEEVKDLKGQVKGLADVIALAGENITNVEKDLFRKSKQASRYLIERIRLTKNAEQLAKIIKEVTDPKLLNYITERAKVDPKFAKAFLKYCEDEKIEIDEKAKEAYQETLKFKNRVKFFFAKISKWFKGKLNPILKSIYSFFVEKGSEDGFTIKWAHVAIVVAVIAVIGFALFGPYGRQIKNFLFNALKGGFAVVKSAVRYVLGKGGAPKEVVDETEDFLDGATA